MQEYPPPMGDARRPAKRAAVLMWIIGGILLAGGMCCGGFASVPLDQWPAESQPQMQELQADLDFSVQALFAGMAMFVGIPGLALVILAFFVRGGGAGAVITGIVFTSLFALLIGAWVILGGLGLISGGGIDGQELLGVCILALPGTLLVWQLVWLVGALRAAPAVQAERMQHASQYWQYQQNQRTYGGYAPPPPPPSPGPFNAPGNDPPPPPA